MSTTGTAAPDRSANRRSPFAGRVAAVAAAAAACLTGLMGAAPVAAQDAGVDIVAVEFDLGEEFGEEGSLQPIGPTQPVSYRSVTINHGGHEIKLAPAREPALSGFRSLGFDDLASVGFGSVVMATGESAPDRLGSSLSSAFVHESIWNDGDGPIDVDISFVQPLADWDFFLIQEASGDAAIELSAVSGGSTGPAVTIGGYDWDTGYPTSTDVDGRHWARVVPVKSLPGDQNGIDGLALTLPAGTDLKIVPLQVVSTRPPAGDENPADDNTETTGGADNANDGGGSLAGAEASTGDGSNGSTTDSVVGAEADTGAGTDGTETKGDADAATIAAVGLNATFRPGTSADGASCVDPALEGALSIALPGEQATYCFAVTNLGTTPLDRVRLTDQALGIQNGNLPLASGSDVIQPGETSVYYHHATIGARGAGSVSSVTATTPAADLESPRAESAELTMALGQAVNADSRAAAGGEPTAAPAPTPTPTETTTPAPTTVAPTTPAESGGDSPTAAQTDSGSGSESGSGSGSGAGSGEGELAFTGPGIEPWVLLVFAVAFMFFGYTLMVAFRRSPIWAKLTGHAQLDAMGFDRF